MPQIQESLANAR